MPPLSNPSNNIGMVMEHGMHLPANMLGKTSGRLRSRSKSNCCTHVSGKARVTSCKLMQEQRCELSEWQQNNPDALKPSYVKKPGAPGRPTKSKQISMLVSQQVAAKIQKYTTSAHDRLNTVDNSTADQDQHLKSIVQSAVAKHFKIHKPMRPLRIPLANWSFPPASWGE